MLGSRIFLVRKNNSVYDVVLHLGLSKTGTTFLQKNVFPFLDGVEFFDNNEFRISSALSREKVNLISDETFSNDYLWFDNAGRFEVADRLYRLFPDAKVMVFVRDVESFKRSMYKEYVLWGGSLGFDSWVKWCLLSNPGIFDFERYVTYLKKLFDQVLVVDYDDFKKDNQSVISRVCGFMGVGVPVFDRKPLNVSLDEKVIGRWRWWNGFFRNRFQPILPGFSRYLNPLVYYRFIMRRIRR